MRGGIVERQNAWWLLVGGRNRLGRAIAEALAEDHRLILTSSRPWDGASDWLESLSRRTRVRTFEWNADDPELVPKMMADLKCLGDMGITLDAAVLVAGTFPESPFGAWDPAGLADTWRVNLSFPLLVSQAVGPRIAEGGSLQLILDTAIHRPFRKHLPYSAAKAGLASLVPALAGLLAPRVRVVGHAIGTMLPEEGRDPSFLVERSLLKRLGSPGDLVRALRYAAGSPYLTGEILTLDGGRRWL
ncbi:MAG TPA: SDR family oxidoreductase [Holophaga sp.]|nr:SDR family oxidoreductase [Holophaga sp.]HPS68529.1 SDR family oxidoreductase [Holophaga sp.]